MEYVSVINPGNLVETELADIICATQFRRERAVRHETALTLEARAIYGPQLREFYPGISEAFLDGLAFKRLAENSRSVQVLDRYEQRMTNTVTRSWKLLFDLRKNLGSGPNSGPPAPHQPWPHPLPPRVPPPPPPSSMPPNEPIPTSEHPFRTPQFRTPRFPTPDVRTPHFPAPDHQFRTPRFRTRRFRAATVRERSYPNSALRTAAASNSRRFNSVLHAVSSGSGSVL